MTFKTATDRLGDLGVTLDEIAEALGVSYASVKQARMDRSVTNYRNPPAGWQSAIARLARKRIAELAKLAETLERGG